ncbi:unnamed protein product [Candidula unifasciata]|uniref:Uncharacterized protein n=1 Tax=Candidula unifasciata TaxID=100452 RepID=A0A8S3ZIF8_9EUPU|nr:unnamed protein product [Candidula unifasciata]
MCSSCRSDKKPDCESSPPAPQPCTESGSGVIKSCSTIRIYKLDTSELYQFIRSCSSSENPGCFNSKPGYKTCAQICYTDGCNSAWTLHKHPWLFVPMFVSVATLVYSTLC